MTRRAVLATGVGGVAGLAGCQSLGDHATYATAGDNAPVAYTAVRRRARNAGYRVVGPFYVNTREEIGRPLAVPALTDRYGTDARALHVTLHYSPSRLIEATFPDGEATTRLLFLDETLVASRPFGPRNLPPTDWLVAQFRTVFRIDAATAARLVASVRAAAADTTDTSLVYRTDRRVALSAVHRSLVARASAVTTSQTHGDGWVVVSYDADDRLGEFALVVPSVRIQTRDRGHRYRIKLDREGGFWLSVLLPPGERVPERRYRSVFHRMFETVGLPAERVEDYEFTYTPSNW